MIYIQSKTFTVYVRVKYEARFSFSGIVQQEL